MSDLTQAQVMNGPLLKIDYSHTRLEPYLHQKIGVKAILEHPHFFLADEMGAGKTKQTIDAAQFLFHAGEIDQVIVVAPASVRGVWFDQELGELRKHLWNATTAGVMEYHSRQKIWHWPRKPQPGEQVMRWIITNYDFIRNEDRLEEVKALVTDKTMLVLDESSAVKNHKAQQTAAVKKLRLMCKRVLLLNGTPIANSPMDIYAQADIMNPHILGMKSFFHFRSKYAVMGGFENRQVISFVNLKDLQERMAPFVLRRLKIDCLDLPEKLPPVSLSVPLTAATWKMYREMRDDMVAELRDGTISTAQQAIVKALRLSQITSGFVGGVERAIEPEEQAQMQSDRPQWIPLPFEAIRPAVLPATAEKLEAKEISREKLDFLLEWIGERIEADPGFKVIIWCRFVAEMKRAAAELAKKFPKAQVQTLYGSNSKDERQAALRMLDPRTAPSGPGLLVGTLGTGSKGLNLTAAHTMVYLSYDHSLEKFLQGNDRVHRPGQVHPVSYYDIIATGPKGQKTIDHHIIQSRYNKDSLATWTVSAWQRALTEE